MDERSVMSSNQTSGRIIRRLVPPPPAVLCTGSMAGVDEGVGGHETPLGACLLAPTCSGAAGWGVRRKVRYIGPNRDTPPSSPAATVEEAGEQELEQEQEQAGTKRRSSAERKKKKKGDKRAKKKPRRDKKEERKRKGKDESEQESRARGSKDRWSAERYEAAELKLLEIMRELGADLQGPILRQELRQEARNHIGDTGLLDHLLKHMVGKVVSDGTERFRRRHNSEGAMEYWLEPADLVEIRRRAGVLDPYWVPPPGWKLGDAVYPCPCSADCKKEMSQLKEDVAALKRDYQSLKRKVQEEMAGMSSCLQALKEEMRLMKEEKNKKPKFAGACH